VQARGRHGVLAAWPRPGRGPPPRPPAVRGTGSLAGHDLFVRQSLALPGTRPGRRAAGLAGPWRRPAGRAGPGV